LWFRKKKEKKKLKERIVLTVLSHKPPPPFPKSCILEIEDGCFLLVFSLDLVVVKR